LKFFNEGEGLNEKALPVWMQTGEMKQAMSTLKAFSEKERAYHAYQARQNYLRVQRSNQERMDELQREMEQARVAREQALVARERERTAKEQERAAKEQALMAEEQERAAKEQERAAKMEALAEVDRLKKLLEGRSDDATYVGQSRG